MKCGVLLKSYVFVCADLRAPIRMPVVALMNKLAQQGHTVTVITNQKSAFDDYRYDYRIVRRSLAEPFKGLNTRGEIITHIASQMPESVFILTNLHTLVPDARSIRAAEERAHKIVVWELLPLYSLLLKTNYADFSSVQTCSDLFDAFVTNYAQDETLHRAFDLPHLHYIPFFFPFQSSEYSVIEGTGKQILFVQNGAQNYMFDCVLRSLAIVRETDADVTLKFVNGLNTSAFSEDTQKLAYNLAEQYGVADAISFAEPGGSLKSLMRESLFAVSAAGTASHSSATMLMHASRFPYIFACGYASVDNFACLEALDATVPEKLADEMLRCLQDEVRAQKQKKMTKALDAGVDLFALRSWETLLGNLAEGMDLPDFCEPSGVCLQSDDLLAQATLYHIQRTGQNALVPALDNVPRKRFARIRKTLRYWELRRTQKYTYTQMSPEDVRRSQLLALMLLREFERICIRHNLVYYVAAGSLLGAVRHHGPIPWDDDVDVTMPRKDYNAFIRIAQDELPDTMILPKNNYPYAFHRMQMKGTNIERTLRQHGHHGIFLDILPLDGAAPTEQLKKRHEWINTRLMFYMFESARPIQPLNQIHGNWKPYIKRMILKVFAPRHILQFLWRKNAEKYDVDTAKEWVCLPGSYGYEKECFPKSFWGEPAWLEYEHKLCPVMRHWEDYLQMHYGDYMQCPSELEKRTHLLFSIDFGKYGAVPIPELERSVLQTSESLQEASAVEYATE